MGEEILYKLTTVEECGGNAAMGRVCNLGDQDRCRGRVEGRGASNEESTKHERCGSCGSGAQPCAENEPNIPDSDSLLATEPMVGQGYNGVQDECSQ
jgi:hypothetical protein